MDDNQRALPESSQRRTARDRFSLIELLAVVGGLAIGMALCKFLLSMLEPGRWGPETTTLASVFLGAALGCFAGAGVGGIRQHWNGVCLCLAPGLVALSIGVMIPFESYPDWYYPALWWSRQFIFLPVLVAVLGGLSVMATLRILELHPAGSFRPSRKGILLFGCVAALVTTVILVGGSHILMRGESAKPAYSSVFFVLILVAAGALYLAGHVLKRGWHSAVLVAVAVVLAVGISGGPIFILNTRLLRFRINWNESSAISSMRTINTAEQQYKSTEGSNVYGTLAQMSSPNPPFVDTVLGTGTKSGYLFDLEVGPQGQTWSCRAVPRRDYLPWWYWHGRRFFTDHTGVIRAGANDMVDADSRPID